MRQVFWTIDSLEMGKTTSQRRRYFQVDTSTEFSDSKRPGQIQEINNITSYETHILNPVFIVNWTISSRAIQFKFSDL